MTKKLHKLVCATFESISKFYYYKKLDTTSCFQNNKSNEKSIGMKLQIKTPDD